ncbi:hypothetical protein [Dickeya zeae]
MLRWATSPGERHGCRESSCRVGQKRRECF